MKKFTAVILVLMSLVMSVAFAEADYASMSDDELHALIDGARNELARRELIAAENTVLCEQEGVTIYMTGEYSVDERSSGNYLILNVVCVNDSKMVMNASCEDASVNGWNVSATGVYEVPAGKKQKGKIEFKVSDADVSDVSELEDAEMVFRFYNSENYNTISETDPITIHFNAD